MTFKILLTGFLFLTCSTLTWGHAFEIEPIFQYRIYGTTSVQIGGHVAQITPSRTFYSTYRFPVSELLYTTQTHLGGVRFTWHPFPPLAIAFSGQSTAGFQPVADTEDRDWGTEYLGFNANADPNVNDLISFSDTVLKSREFTLSAMYSIQPTSFFSFRIGGRAHHIHHHFKAFDTYQIASFTTGQQEQFIPGNTLTNDQNSFLGFFVGGLSVEEQTYGLDLEAAYAPRAYVRDEDHHLVRGKLNTVDAIGSATEFKATFFIKASPSLKWYISYRTFFLRAYGIQTQIFSGSSSYNEIDATIHSQHQSVELGVKINV